MASPIVIEPPRFGRTGPNFMSAALPEFLSDAMAGCIDAPEHIARGSTKVAEQEFGTWSQHYVSFTDARRDS